MPADRGDLDRVRESTDLVDLISEVTKVRKSGRSFMAVCPFHEEKTPSMSVDRARGLYHCFGCGEGGDVFTFVQKTQGVDFPEAVELLARRAGITLTRDPDAAQRRGRRAEAVEAVRDAIEIYHERLKKAPEAGPARAYLRARGYDVEVIDNWRLGFAGLEWDILVRELRTRGVAERAMIDAGLARRGRQGLFDVFRGRLMFPIHDVRGDPVGFGARRIAEIDRRSTNNPEAKYVNSADSIIYHKGDVLFGLDRARQAISSEGRAVIVEGYTDVMAMHLAGVGTAVATCGTALGDGHFDLLRRFTEQVVLAFDSDEAGSRAAMRSDDLAAPFRLDLDLRVAVMPDGLDPADLVQEGRGGELEKAVETARPLLEHRLANEVSRHDLTGPEGKARALHAAVDLLRRVGDEIARREYSRFVSRLIGVDLFDVEQALRTGKIIQQGAHAPQEQPLDRSEAELLRVVLANPSDLGEVTEDDFDDPRLRAAFAQIAPSLAETPSGTPLDITWVSDPEAVKVLRALVMDPQPLPEPSDIRNLVRLRRIESQIDEMEAEIESLGAGSESHSEALRRLIALQREKRALGG